MAFRPDAPTDLLLALDYRIRHLLVDEFQDTSFTQFELLRRLTAGWSEGDGRTLFVVGDPMQSIYRFREAEVGLFLLAWHHGIGSVPLEPLTLSANFRSQAGIVDWVNTAFARVKVPTEILPRFVAVGEGHRFVLLEDVIAHHLDALFPGMEIADYDFFRVTRDADLAISDEADDLLQAVEEELRRRRLGEVVRVEVGARIAARLLGELTAALNVSPRDVYPIDGMLDLTSLLDGNHDFVGVGIGDIATRGRGGGGCHAHLPRSDERSPAFCAGTQCIVL